MVLLYFFVFKELPLVIKARRLLAPFFGLLCAATLPVEVLTLIGNGISFFIVIAIVNILDFFNRLD